MFPGQTYERRNESRSLSAPGLRPLREFERNNAVGAFLPRGVPLELRAAYRRESDPVTSRFATILRRPVGRPACLCLLAGTRFNIISEQIGNDLRVCKSSSLPASGGRDAPDEQATDRVIGCENREREREGEVGEGKKENTEESPGLVSQRRSEGRSAAYTGARRYKFVCPGSRPFSRCTCTCIIRGTAVSSSSGTLLAADKSSSK